MLDCGRLVPLSLIEKERIVKSFTRRLKVILTVSVLAALPALANDKAGDDPVRVVVSTYQQALNGNDAEVIARLFTGDGVVLLQGAPSRTGPVEVRDLYANLFKSIHLDIQFDIAEILPVSPEWTIVRTTSHGTVNILSNGSQGQSVGHELFILKKQTDGTWKIARYAASSSQ